MAKEDGLGFVGVRLDQPVSHPGLERAQVDPQRPADNLCGPCRAPDGCVVGVLGKSDCRKRRVVGVRLGNVRDVKIEEKRGKYGTLGNAGSGGKEI